MKLHNRFIQVPLRQTKRIRKHHPYNFGLTLALNMLKRLPQNPMFTLLSPGV